MSQTDKRSFGMPLSESQLNSRSTLNNNRLSLYSNPKTPKSILKQPATSQNHNNSRLTLGANQQALNTSLNSSRMSNAHNMSLNKSFDKMNTSKTSSARSNSEQAFDVNKLSKFMLSYLSQKGYPHDINIQKLKLPTATEFSMILEFLVSQLDSGLRMKLPTPSQLKKETEKMEKEMASRRRTTSFKSNTSLLNSVKDQKTSVNGFDEQLFLDLINYFKHPSPPNNKFVEKSAFTPRGWPKLLSVITWLVDLLRYYEFKSEKLRVELQEGHEGVFFMYLHQTYGLWLNEDEEGMQRVVNEWQKNFFLKAQSIQVQTEELNGKNQEVLARISSIIPRLQQRKIFESQKQDFIADLSKFEAVIRELHNSKRELEDAVAVDELELSSLQSELVKISRERESLRIQIEHQELRPQDVLRMNKNRAALEDEIRKVAEERDAKNNQLFSLENECRVEIDKMMKNVQQYNQLAMLLPVDTEDEMDEDANSLSNFDLIVTQEQMKDLIPAVDHIDCSQPETNSMDDTQTLSFAVSNFPSNPIVYQPNIDLFEVDSKIKRLKDEMVSSTRSMQDHVYELNEKYDSVDDMCQRQEEKIKELERKLDKERVSLASSKQDWDSEIQRIHLEIEEVEQETKTARNNNHNLYSQLAESERRIQQLYKEQQLMETQFEAELIEMNKLLLKSATSVYQHKEFIQKSLTKVQDDRAKVIERTSFDQ